MTFSEKVFKIDPEFEIRRISLLLTSYLQRNHRDGFVIGLSGGIDSALTLSLCVKAIGKERIFGVMLPERDSNPISEKLASEHAESLDIEYIKEDITNVLECLRTYEKRDEVIRKLYPGYNKNHIIKIYLPRNLLKEDQINYYSLEILDGDRTVFNGRLKKRDLQAIMAATDTKQRTRMMHLYYQAELRNYAVCGTTNKTEMIQGYFVKFGDGGVDIEPLAHLYKQQVYSLSEYLNVHQGIIDREPSPDTFNSHMSDEEFFFRMPYRTLDLLLYAWEKKIDIDDVSKAMGLEKDQIQRAMKDFSRKYNASQHLRSPPPTIFDLSEMQNEQ